MTSRQYFDSQVPLEEGPFSVVFVDGMHLWTEAAEDIACAFLHLRPGGFIVVDDVYPSGYWEGLPVDGYDVAVREAAARGYELRLWMGDVWRAIRAVALADVPGLRWATVRVTGPRFHTVFWMDRPGDVVPALRKAFERERAQRPLFTRRPRARIGRRGLPAWYHGSDLSGLLAQIQKTSVISQSAASE